MSVWAKRLKTLRDEKGLSQGQIATFAGVAQSTLSDIENDKIAPKTIKAIVELAKYYKVSTDYIFGLPTDTISGMVLSKDEIEVVRTYRLLTDPQRTHVKEYLSYLEMANKPHIIE